MIDIIADLKIIIFQHFSENEILFFIIHTVWSSLFELRILKLLRILVVLKPTNFRWTTLCFNVPH